MNNFVPGGEEDLYNDDEFILDFDEIKDVNLPTVERNTEKKIEQRPFDDTKKNIAVSRTKFKFTNEDFRLAAMKKDMKILAQCLEQGIPIDTVLKSGWTVLMYAANSSQPDVVAFLLENGANPNFESNKYSVLMAASGSNHSSEAVFECVRMLVEKGANLNDFDRYHISPLLYAAREGQVEVVKYLLDHGAYINNQDTRGWTALSWATHRHNCGVVKLLLNEGCNQNLKHTDGLLPLDLAIGQDDQKLIAILEGQPPPSQQILVNGDSNSFQTNGNIADEKVDRFNNSYTSSLKENGSGDHNPETVVRKSDYSFANATKLHFNSIHDAINDSNTESKTPIHHSITTHNNQPVTRHENVNSTPTVCATTPDFVKFGELELFLSGLGLTDFVQLFQNQHVNFEMLLCLSEEDLINMGIKQIGVRKKILESIHAVHKKEWETTSLITPQYNKSISCADAVAMVSNISKHLLYISSSIVFINDQLKQYPDILINTQGNISPNQLATHTKNVYQNVSALKTHITNLEKRLDKEMKMIECDLPDLVIKQKQKNRLVIRLAASVVIISTVCLFVWKRPDITEYITKLTHNYL